MDRAEPNVGVSHRVLELHLHDLRVAMEIGFCRNVRAAIELWGGLLETANDPRQRAEYEWLMRKAATMFEVEAVHGAGNLLALDHPMVISLQTWPRSLFAPSELEAARKFRTTHVIGGAVENCTASSRGVRDLTTA